MRRGCFDHVLFGALLLLAFGGSSYFWFTFFVKGRSLPTPNLIGKTVAEARAITQDLGVELEVNDALRRNSDKVPIGNVVWQNRNPGATSFIKRGSRIRVELSAGPLVLRVPHLTAQSPGTATLRLGQQNLRIGEVGYIESSALKGVVAADPPNGTVVAPQSGVSLLVAVPPAPPSYVMPDLIDHRLEVVRPTLEARGLTVATVKYETYPGIADGIIIRQYPLRGAPVSSRDPISLVVSRQEETQVIGAEPEPVSPPPATPPQ